MSSKHRHRRNRESSSRAWSAWEWSTEHAQHRRYYFNSAGVEVWQYERGGEDDLASTIDTPRYIPETTVEQNDLPPIHEHERSAYEYEAEAVGNYVETGGEQPQSSYRETDGNTYEDTPEYQEGGRDSYQEEELQYTQLSQIQGTSSTEYYEGELSGTVSQMRLQDEEDYAESSSDEEVKPPPRPKPEPTPAPRPNVSMVS